MKWYSLGLNNKGHFLLPVLGAVAKGALVAGKVAGTAALKGAAALGKGALAVGKTVGTGAGKFGSQIGKAASKMLGMGGGGGGGINPGTQVATAMGKPVTFGQTAQGAGMSMNPGGVMQGGASGGNKMLDTIKNALSNITGGEKKKEEEIATQPGLIGGGGGIANVQMPQFNRPQSMGALIAQMLQARRGF